MRVLFMDIHLKKLVLLVFVFCKSNFEANIYKKPTWQSAAGQNAQYKGKTNDPGKHENSKGRKVSQIQTKCEEKKVETALEAQNADFPFSALVKETQEEKRNLAALLFTLNLSWQEAFW